MNLFLNSRIADINSGPPTMAIKNPGISHFNKIMNNDVARKTIREGIQLILLKVVMSLFPKKIPELYVLKRLNGIGIRSSNTHNKLPPDLLKKYINKKHIMILKTEVKHQI